MSWRPRYRGDSYGAPEVVLTLSTWLLLLGGFAYYLGWWSPGPGEWHCGAETVAGYRGDSLFVNGGHRFSGVAARSDERALEGRYSVKLEPPHAFGLATRLHDLRPGMAFRATVWRSAADPGYRTNGVLVASMRNTDYYRTGERVIAERDGWQQLELVLDSLPPLLFRSLDVYCWNAQAAPVYFDELHIERLGD